MAKFLVPGSIHEFRPDPDGPVVFKLKAPTEAEKIRWRHAIRTEGGRYHDPQALRNMMRRAVQRLVPEEDQEVYLGAIDEAEAELNASAEASREALAAATDRVAALGEDDADAKEAILRDAVEGITAQSRAAAERAQRSLDVVMELVLNADRILRSAMADNEAWPDIVGMVTARLFVVGWDGRDTPYKGSKLGTSEASLASLSRLELLQLSNEGQWIVAPTEREAKN